MAVSPAVARSIGDHLRTRPVRAKSLAVTIYGDSIAPHGGKVWLSGLIRLMAPFGFNQRAVRTTVFRLAAEGWLRGEQVGRRSHYRLTASGSRRFEAAFRKIYGPAPGDWDGRWRIVLEAGRPLAAARRTALREELAWAGFGRVLAGVWAHPTVDGDVLAALLRELRAEEHVVVLTATPSALGGDGALAAMVQAAWDLQALEQDYRRFIVRFRPILVALRRLPEARLDPEQCFVVRTLLIHEYRRVMLRDPLLPGALLPPGWSGAAARDLCGELYRLTQRRTEQHLLATLGTPEGSLPPASPYFYARFGGIG